MTYSWAGAPRWEWGIYFNPLDVHQPPQKNVCVKFYSNNMDLLVIAYMYMYINYVWLYIIKHWLQSIFLGSLVQATPPQHLKKIKPPPAVHRQIGGTPPRWWRYTTKYLAVHHQMLVKLFGYPWQPIFPIYIPPNHHSGNPGGRQIKAETLVPNQFSCYMD